MALVWIQLATTAAVILLASQFLAKSADIIAEKTGLGRSFVGVVMLATATSLPELGTGISAILLVDAPDLAAGDAFGSNLFNLLIIGLADLIWRNEPILTAVNKTSILVAALGIAAIALAAFAIFVHQSAEFLTDWYISPITLVIILLFLVSMYLIYRGGKIELENAETTKDTLHYKDSNIWKALLGYSVSATVIVVAAVLLSKTGNVLAEEMGWEASFVGTQFLALSTSLPELATSLAALRLNAPDLAISNILGSNLFNMGFVLFADDIVYTKGVVWAAVSQVHLITAAAAIIMTLTVIIALVLRPRPRLGRYWSVEGLALTVSYIAVSILVFRIA